MEKYGEILLLGRCNCRCYYCLSEEMGKLKVDNESQLEIHYSKWERFEEYIKKLKDNNISIVYLSSVLTDPLLYKYIKELVDYLSSMGFRVGIRTNGYKAMINKEVFKGLDSEISFSINSIKNETNKKICGVWDIPDWGSIFSLLDSVNKNCRVSIVVNKYNSGEILDTLEYLSNYRNISYVQLRKIYRYKGIVDSADIVSFNRVVDELKCRSKKLDSYYESDVYEYKGLNISIWRDVFSKDSIKSINYFTNGIISTNNLLVPAYENGECE